MPRQPLSIILLITAGVLFSSCNSPMDAQHPAYSLLSKGEDPQFFSKDDREVLNACFDHRLGGVSNQILMIYDYSISHTISEMVVDTGPLHPLSLMYTFNALNDSSCYHGNAYLDISHDYRYFDRKTCFKMFNDSDDDPAVFWETFRLLFPHSPGGYYLISKIAYNDHHTHALLFMMNLMGPLAGNSGYLALKKTCKKWTVVDDTIIWRL
ncbi:MAG: hypothetical protein JXA71_11245 [Chitinispirillaceae bacterium]|nr:hypothetical protein [Chitinispirillaceae bacterium]